MNEIGAFARVSARPAGSGSGAVIGIVNDAFEDDIAVGNTFHYVVVGHGGTYGGHLILLLKPFFYYKFATYVVVFKFLVFLELGDGELHDTSASATASNSVL